MLQPANLSLRSVLDAGLGNVTVYAQRPEFNANTVHRLMVDEVHLKAGFDYHPTRNMLVGACCEHAGGATVPAYSMDVECVMSSWPS